MLSWLTPEHFLPWVSWHAEVPVFLAALLSAWTAIGMHCRNDVGDVISVPQLAIPFGLFALVAMAQLVCDVMTFWGDLVVVWMYVALCIACLTVGFNHGLRFATSFPSRWASVDWLALAFVAGASASMTLAFAQVFDLWPQSAWIVRMPDLRRPGGNLAQPNQLGTLLVMAMASVGYLHSVRKLSGVLTIAVLMILSAGLAVTESRAGLLSLIALSTWWQVKRRTIVPTVPVMTGFLVMSCAAFMFMGWPALMDAMQLSAGPTGSRFAQAGVRLDIWSQLLEAAWLHPWSGWGIGGVAKAHNAVAHAYPVNNPFSYSHNIVIDLVVWIGFPLGLSLTVLVAAWLWRRARSAIDPVPWYCIAVAVPLMIHSLLEFPFAYAYFLAPVLFLLGVLEACQKNPRKIEIHLKPMLLILVTATVILTWSVAEYLLIEEDFQTARFELLKIGNTPTTHHLPEVYLFTQLGALLHGARVELKPNMPTAEMTQLRQLALRYPWGATQYRYALALLLNGNSEESIRQFQVMRWQQGDKLYETAKKQIDELARTQYPQLRGFSLP
jgi:O-antigen ligase